MLDLRAALIEMYSLVGADPGTPQETSRALGINKNLTWKVSRLMTSADALTVVPLMPGASGWDILLERFTGAGASPASVAKVKHALAGFDDVVTRHAGDRAQLELILDSMGCFDGTMPLEASRELAFRGNSGIWGVQARTRLTVAFVVPSKTEPDRLDAALISGLVDVRRLRPQLGWTLFRFRLYNDDGTMRQQSPESIEQGSERGLPRMLTRFCSANMPELRLQRGENNVTEYVLPGGPIGRTAGFTCFFGEIMRGLPMHSTPENRRGEFTSGVSIPVETLVLDLLVHRDVRMGGAPEVGVFGTPTGRTINPTARSEESRLPLAEKLVEIAGAPPAIATPMVPRYSEIADVAYARLGYPGSAFRGYRLVLPFPPLSSTTIVGWSLPERA